MTWPLYEFLLVCIESNAAFVCYRIKGNIEMNEQYAREWPSGDCRPVLATAKTVSDLVDGRGIATFREKDDLDWFEGARLTVDGIGPVLIMKHDNNPENLTVLYVDSFLEPLFAEEQLTRYFDLSGEDVAWCLSKDLKRNDE